MWLWLTRVHSASMAPTLPDGALALTSALRRTTPLTRGDVVVVDAPAVEGRVVKRIIGLPGETVTIADGLVHIDGRALDEPYASRSVFNGTFRVPSGHYFLLGDNRDASTDSRSWPQPFVARTALRGRVRLPRRRRARPQPRADRVAG